MLGCYWRSLINALSRMLRRELLAAPQGAGRGGIDGDGGIDCGKKDNEERGRMAARKGERRAGGEERMVTSKEAVWKRTAAVVVVTVGMGERRQRGGQEWRRGREEGLGWERSRW